MRAARRLLVVEEGCTEFDVSPLQGVLFGCAAQRIIVYQTGDDVRYIAIVAKQ